MSQKKLFESWSEVAVHKDDGPSPVELMSTDGCRVVVVGLQPGQKIPPHDGPPAVYHVLEGSGAIIVDDERLEVEPGAIVVVPQGSARGMEARTRLSVLACRAT